MRQSTNTLNNVQVQKLFTDFDLLMQEKQLLVKRKLERLKFTIEKQTCRLRK